MKDRSDDISHHERTLLPESYISLISIASTRKDIKEIGTLRVIINRITVTVNLVIKQ